MCAHYIIRGKRYETQGELAALVGRGVLALSVGDDYPDPLADDTCLCPVRRAMIAEHLRMTFRDDGFDVIFEEKADA